MYWVRCRFGEPAFFCRYCWCCVTAEPPQLELVDPRKRWSPLKNGRHGGSAGGGGGGSGAGVGSSSSGYYRHDGLSEKTPLVFMGGGPSSSQPRPHKVRPVPFAISCGLACTLLA
jgi:hypothetical protein